MKRIFGITLALFLSLTFASEVLAKEKPRLGVLRFTNSSAAAWWSGGTGRDLQDMLIAELASMESFNVLERKEIDAVMSEQNLGQSGRVSKSTRSKIGRITGAKYLVAATVSSFEKGTSGEGAGVSFGGFSIGGKKEKAYMAVDLKVIDVETGEIADVRTVEANSSSGGLNLGMHKWGFGGNLGKEQKTPTGKAIRACVMEIAEYLECSMVKGKSHSCMDDYNAKEDRRRTKTKSSIELE